MKKKTAFFSIFFFLLGMMVFAKESANAVVTEMENVVKAYETLVDRIVRTNKITDVDERQAYDLEARMNQVNARANNKNLFDDWTENHQRRVNNALTRMEHVQVKLNGWLRNRQ
jgi:hypothetical protein